MSEANKGPEPLSSSFRRCIQILRSSRRFCFVFPLNHDVFSLHRLNDNSVPELVEGPEFMQRLYNVRNIMPLTLVEGCTSY